MLALISILRLLALAPLLGILTAAPEKVTYDDHILPIFENSCTNCHNPDKKKGGLDLSSYSAAMAGGSGGKIAIAGEGADSRIFLTATHSEEPFMPPKGDKLDKKQLTSIRSWIDGGLLETMDSRAKKSIQTKISFKSSSVGKPEGPPPMPENLTVEPHITPTKPTAIHAMACSPWAPLVAITGQSQVLLYHSESLELIGILPFPKGQPTALAFHPSGTFLTAAGGTPGKSGTTTTWEVISGKIVATTAKEYDSILTTSMRSDMQAVATGGPSRLVKTWGTADNTIEHSIKKHTDWVTALSFSNDGVLLASADRNGGMWVWEAYSGQQLHDLRGHQGQITKVIWSADSNFLASSSEDGSVRFWDMNSGKQIKKLDAHKGGVLGFDWAKDGHILTAGRDKKIKLWKPDYKLIKELASPTHFITKACFSHDAKRFFTADFDGRVFVWDSKTFEQIGEISSVPASIATRLAAASQVHSKVSSASAKAQIEMQKSEAKHQELSANHKKNEQQLSANKAEIKQLESQLKQAQQTLKNLSNDIVQADRKVKGLQNQVKIKTNDNAKKHTLLEQAQDDHNKKNMAVADSDKRLEVCSKSLQQAEQALSSNPDDTNLQQARSQRQTELRQQTSTNKTLIRNVDRAAKLMELRAGQAQKSAEVKQTAEVAHKKDHQMWQNQLQEKQQQTAALDSLKKRHNELREAIPQLQKSLPNLVKQRDAEKIVADQRKIKAIQLKESEGIAHHKMLSLQLAQKNEPKDSSSN